MAVCIDNNSSSFSSICKSQCQIKENSSRTRLSKSNMTNLVSTGHVVDPIHHPHHQYQDNLWLKMQEEAKSDIQQDPILLNYYHSLVLSHPSLESALANHLAIKLSNSSFITSDALVDIFYSVIKEDSGIKRGIRKDIKAVKERDPACISHVHCFLNYKGFLACQAYRIGHKLFLLGRRNLAFLIQNRISEVFAVDIHPGAEIGHGIVLDHATGIVIGETSVIGNNVTILHNVTLGGTGKVTGDRHPKVCDDVLIGAGTKVLGDIRIGQGAKIGAGSVVLKDVPPHSTAVGNPSRLVGLRDVPKL